MQPFDTCFYTNENLSTKDYARHYIQWAIMEHLLYNYPKVNNTINYNTYYNDEEEDLEDE